MKNDDEKKVSVIRRVKRKDERAMVEMRITCNRKGDFS